MKIKNSKQPINNLLKNHKTLKTALLRKQSNLKMSKRPEKIPPQRRCIYGKYVPENMFTIIHHWRNVDENTEEMQHISEQPQVQSTENAKRQQGQTEQSPSLPVRMQKQHSQ